MSHSYEAWQCNVVGRGMAVTEDSASRCETCASFTSTLTDARLGVSRLARKANLFEFCHAGRPSARVEKVWREVGILRDRLNDYEADLRTHRAHAHSSAA